MALRAFVVTNKKALVRAECESVPSLMVIAGPNGVGKSSLLYALKRREGTTFDDDTEVLYQPPLRAIRRQTVRRQWLRANNRGISQLLSDDEVNGYEGFNIQFPQRVPDNVDESGSTLKYSLGRVESRRESALAALIDDALATAGALSVDGIADVYKPIKRLLATLLPHLEFKGITFKDEDDIGVTFRTVQGERSVDVDLNDLSTGEKAILLLFLPLIEAEIDNLVVSIGSPSAARPIAKDRVFLIDEPEEHLHPELQGRVLTYLREEASHGRLQAVLVTHSPALLDLATDDELFVLNRPNGDLNQLARIVSSAERLAALKELVGSPYIVTTGRTIVLVEGPPGAGSSTDVRLLDRIHPAATKFTFIPMGGRSSVLAAVRGLRQQVSEARFGISVLGLVDRDRAEPTEEGIVAWPFATVENLLLLDSEAISRAIDVLSQHAVAPGRIDEILLESGRAMRTKEIQLRVSERLKLRVIRLEGTSVDDLQQLLTQRAEDFSAEARDAASLAAVVDEANATVDGALNDGRFRTLFRGKELLHALVGELALHRVSYTDFVYALAETCADSPLVQAAVQSAFELLDTARANRLSLVAAATPIPLIVEGNDAT